MKKPESAAGANENTDATKPTVETVTETTTDTAPAAAESVASEPTKKTVVVNPWVAAGGVVLILGVTYFTGRYFGYQAALRAVAAAASHA